MSRTFFVRVNMDDMCAELDTLRPDQHAEWLAGFRAGCRGRIPGGWDGPRLMGAEFGMSCWEEAEGYRAKQSECGKRSAAVRKQKFGTAIPEGGSNHATKVVRRSSEPEPNPSNIQHPTSNNEQPEATAPASHCDIFDQTAREATPAPVSPTMEACDAKFTHGDLLSQVKLIGGKLTKANGNLAEWEGIIAEHGWDAVSHAAKKVGPAERWPDRVAQAIWDKDKCPHPPGTDAAMNWYALHMEVK